MSWHLLNLRSLVVASSFLILAPASHALNLCQSVFELSETLSQSAAFPQDPATLHQVKAEIANSQLASDFFMLELRKQSEALKAANQNKVLELDFLCLGAGPQCAAASLVLGGLNLRSLVLEKTDLVAKTFAEKDFFINSTEDDGLSMHQFPGGVGSLAEHTSQKYASSSQLAAHIQMQQFASNVPVLLNTKMTQVRILKKNGKSLLEITTDQGLVITTKNLILGTGLGEIGTKVQDVNYKAAFENNYRKYLEQPDTTQPIMSTDTLLAAIKNASFNGKKILMPKHMIMVGDGDGSRISIEGLLSPSVELPKDFHITWIGNNFKTAQDYFASRNGGDRYIHQIIPFYNRGEISGQPGHVQTWELRPDSSMRLTSIDKKTHEVYETVGDMIVDATGYENTLPGLLSHLGVQEKMADVVGPLPELNLETTVLARQALSEKGQTLPIYMIGAAAGPLATAGELSGSPNKNPIAIFNTVARTSTFISRLNGVTPPTSARGARDGRPTVHTAADLIKEAKRHRHQQINRPLSLKLDQERSLRAA